MEANLDVITIAEVDFERLQVWQMARDCNEKTQKAGNPLLFVRVTSHVSVPEGLREFIPMN